MPGRCNQSRVREYEAEQGAGSSRLVWSTMDYDQVLPRVFVGSYPASLEDIDRLVRDAGITAVLNLQTDEDADYLNVDGACLAAHYHRRAGAAHAGQQRRPPLWHAAARRSSP